MPTLTDARFNALRMIVPTAPPTTNDMLFAWALTQGGSGLTLNDRIYSMLITRGATPGHVNDMWRSVLTAGGFTGALNDQMRTFWEAGGSFHDLDLTLLYKFAANKTLDAIDGLGPTLTITRTTERRVYDSAGVLTTVASGVAGFDHLPISPFTSLGLLAEEARTNICLQSEDFGAAAYTAIGTPIINLNATIAPDGTMTADNINDDSGAAFEGVAQAIAVPNDNATYTCTLYVKKTTGGTSATFGLNFRFSGGSQPVLNPKLRINTDTGDIFDLNGGIIGVEDVGDFWRINAQLINNTTGNTTIDVQIFAATNTNGVITADLAAAIGIVTLWGLQVEVGTFPTTYIPTVASSVTRNQDQVKTTDVSWYNSNEGTLYARVSVCTLGTAVHIFVISDNSNSNQINLFKNGNNDARYSVVSGGTISASFTTAGEVWDAVDTFFKHAVCYKLDDFELYFEGVRTGTGDQLGAVPVGITNLNIGSAFGNFQIISGHISEIRYYNVRKDNQFLEDLSNGLKLE